MIENKVKMIKKTVVLHPIMDSYIRKKWAILIENGHGANYSTALDRMLLAAIMEVTKEGGCLRKLSIQYEASWTTKPP